MKLGPRPLRRLVYLSTLAVALILVVVATSAIQPNSALASDPLVWITKAPMPIARNGPGIVAASNGKIYAISGGTATGASEDVGTANEYNPATNTWAARAPIPTPRFTFGVAEATNGKIYAIGGYDGVNYVATVEEYDPATDSWTTATSMPTTRCCTGAAASGGKIYAIGGSDGVNALATVEEATGAGPAPTPTPTATPVPGVSTLGMMVLAVLLMAAFLWVRRRRQLAD